MCVHGLTTKVPLSPSEEISVSGSQSLKPYYILICPRPRESRKLYHNCREHQQTATTTTIHATSCTVHPLLCFSFSFSFFHSIRYFARESWIREKEVSRKEKTCRSLYSQAPAQFGHFFFFFFQTTHVHRGVRIDQGDPESSTPISIGTILPLHNRTIFNANSV